MIFRVILLIFLSEVCSSIGQIYFKKGADKTNGSYAAFIKRVLSLPVIWLGLFYSGVSMVLWLAALAQAKLSVVYPIDAMQYILMLGFAYVFLKERIDRYKVIGTLLIVAGICFVAGN